MKEYLSTAEIMEELGISKSTVQRVRNRMRELTGKKGGLSPRCMTGDGRRMRFTDFVDTYGGLYGTRTRETRM